MTGKYMTVGELREALGAYDPSLPVAGLTADETYALLTGVRGVRVADDWDDCLPAGERYLTFDYSVVVPHMRGDPQGLHDHVPPRPPALRTYRCRHCGWTAEAASPMSCGRCEWKPMCKPGEEQ